MYLYEKNKDKIDVYELKARRDKLFDFKRREMEKEDLDHIVFKLQSNNKDDLQNFRDSRYSGKFIDKKNYIFKHKNGIKLNNVIYLRDNGLIIDGLLYRLYRGEFDYYPGYKIIISNHKNKKYLLLTDPCIEEQKTKIFDAESYKYSLDNVISLPESMYLLRKLIEQDYSELVDKNIEEQLSLYDFNDEPIKKLDLKTIEFTNKNSFSDNDLELEQIILKKVRQIHK